MAGEMALWVKCLLYKLTDLSSDPKHSHKSQARVLLILSSGLAGCRQVNPGDILGSQSGRNDDLGI